MEIVNTHETRIARENILRLADNMAAAATGFNSHGYDVFINSRNELFEFIEKTFDKLESALEKVQH